MKDVILGGENDLIFKERMESVENMNTINTVHIINQNNKCPNCGVELTHFCYTTNPPQYETKCFNCGYTKPNTTSTIDLEPLNTLKKRGFEFISIKQQLEDFKDDVNIMQLKLPKRGTSKSAGYDIFAPYDITLQPNEEINVPTGLKAYMQDGEVLMAFPRSGLGFKFYCRLANTVGVIDSDYYNNPKNEGHMFVKLRNEGTKEMIIKQGEGMCQMLFMPFLLADDDSFDEGETRQGGFGSTTK